MIAETKRRVVQLVEINRALTYDLDLSHRKTARLARERDALRREVEQLRCEAQISPAAPAAEDPALREDLQQAIRCVEQLRFELQDAEQARAAASARAERAEHELHVALAELSRSEEDREVLRLQLDESVGTLEEIRVHLIDLGGPAPLSA